MGRLAREDGARVAAGEAGTRAPRAPRWFRSDGVAALGFLAPSLSGFLLFIIGPMVAAVVLSFYSWNLLASPEFVGLENYRRLAADVRLASVYWATAKIGVLVVVGNVIIGLLVAALLEARMPGRLRSFFRLTYLFPFVISAAAVSLIWNFLLNRDLGLLNYVLSLMGIDRVNWMNSSSNAPISVALVTLWRSIGFSILIFIAGLQGISREVLDAARVDGAGPLASFFRVTLPLLSPTVLFVVVINTINAVQIFAEPFVLTGGGPGDSSRTIVMYIYDRAFQSFELGYASTIALTLFVGLGALTALQFRLSRRWTFYG